MSSAGEFIIDQLDGVEDAKGNSGDRGRMIITNLRLLWIHAKRPHINLSIGLECVQKTVIRSVDSKLRGRTQALYVLSAHEKAKYEFIFTHSLHESPRLFTTVQTVSKAYHATHLFRELKLRAALFRNKNQLLLLPGNEEVLDEVINGVWNLSGEQGHLGAFHVTNLRIIWQSLMNDVFNMSLPFLQIQNIMKQDSKYGKALVFETTTRAGSYMLGFRVDPPEALNHCFQKLTQLWILALKKPTFGISVEEAFVEEKSPLDRKFISQWAQQDDMKIIDEQEAYSFLSPTSGSHPTSQDQEDKYRKGTMDENTTHSWESNVYFEPEIGLTMEKFRKSDDSPMTSWRQLWQL